MSQRASGYEREELDRYETPEWVTEALVPHLPRKVETIWEPAAGTGKMVRVLKRIADVFASDIDVVGNVAELDFIGSHWGMMGYCGLSEPGAIITNPPYDLATEFVHRALGLMEPNEGFVAMLLRTDFDHAKTRANLFADHKAFAKKVVLTKRIKWFEESKGQPSFNHAWFIWDWQHRGPPTLAYGPTAQRNG
jgi:hypothetical protein